MIDAPRSLLRLLGRALAVPALVLSLATPALADDSAPSGSAPIADGDKPAPSDDPLEGINIDEPMGQTKGKKGRKPATPPAPKPGRNAPKA